MSTSTDLNATSDPNATRPPTTDALTAPGRIRAALAILGHAWTPLAELAQARPVVAIGPAPAVDALSALAAVELAGAQLAFACRQLEGAGDDTIFGIDPSLPPFGWRDDPDGVTRVGPAIGAAAVAWAASEGTAGDELRLLVEADGDGGEGGGR